MSSSICPDCLLQACPGLNLYGLFKWQLCCFCTRIGAGESLVRSDPQCLGAGLQRCTTRPTSPSLGGLPTCLGCCEEAGLFQTHRPLCLPQFRRTFPLCLSKAFPSLSLSGTVSGTPDIMSSELQVLGNPKPEEEGPWR